MAVSMQLDTQRMSVSEGISRFRIKEFLLCVAWCWARFGMVEDSISVQSVKFSELTHGAAAWSCGDRHEHTSCLGSARASWLLHISVWSRNPSPCSVWASLTSSQSSLAI